jgi:hypothetical protein
VVHDSLGTAASGATVRLVAEFDSAGIAPVVIATTDPAGIAVATLAQGLWGVHALASGSVRNVAGATFSVPGLTRPEMDTIVVRLTLHTPSVARGLVLLGSGAVHGGTIVACPPAPAVEVTDSSGAFALDLLPLGRWTITMHHPGFRLGLARIEIMTPADTLTVADVHWDQNLAQRHASDDCEGKVSRRPALSWSMRLERFQTLRHPEPNFAIEHGGDRYNMVNESDIADAFGRVHLSYKLSDKAESASG